MRIKTGKALIRLRRGFAELCSVPLIGQNSALKFLTRQYLRYKSNKLA